MIKKILKRILSPIVSDSVVIKISDTAPWLYFSYLPHVFKRSNDEQFMNEHQANRETIKMVEIFGAIGYNVYLQDYTSVKKLPDIKPKIIIGLEPNFNRACIKWPAAKKVYFATGAYWEHANKQIINMTDYINKKYNGHIKYHRLTQPHQASQLADAILQIGSNYTIETYPDDVKKKITTIDQSSLGEVLNKQYASENHFFFMGSRSNVLKGVAFLLEYFSMHPELTLHWVGPVDQDFHDTLSHLITPNIHTYGFVNLNSDIMTNIVSKCNFLIYPSGTEGCPGAVINSMKMGLIPIVTPWAAFDGIESLGYVMKDWSLQSVDDGVNWALSLGENEVKSLSLRCRENVCKKFNLDRFGEQLKHFILSLIDDKKV